MNKKMKMNLQRFADDAVQISRANAEGLLSDEQSREVIEGIIGDSAVLSMGTRLRDLTKGARELPVQEALPIAYVVGADGKKKTTNAEWDKKKIVAEEIAVIVPIKQDILDDADFDIWGMLRPQLSRAFGAKIDELVFAGGDDVPTSWPAGIIPMATSAGSVVTATGDLYQDLLGEEGAIAKVEESGYFVNGNFGNVRLRAKLRGLVDGNKRPLFVPDMQHAGNYQLDGSQIKFDQNNILSSNLLVTGDFSKLVYAVRNDISFKLFDTGVIQNTDGTIAFNLLQEDMVALRATMRLGWQLPNPVTAQKGKSAAATRFPFAVLKPNA